jgi:hypothetical protein
MAQVTRSVFIVQGPGKYSEYDFLTASLGGGSCQVTIQLSGVGAPSATLRLNPTGAPYLVRITSSAMRRPRSRTRSSGWRKANDPDG